jgi:replicative DNA helicase
MTYLSGAALIDPLLADIKGGKPPPSWPSGDPAFEHIEVGPGRIVLVGGPPGAGKTALFGQWTVGMLLANPDLRILIANVEMPADALLTRQLARLSGIPLTTIRRRQVQPCDVGRLDDAARVLRSVADRLAFAAEPHRLEAVATAGTDFGADLLSLDYVQRIEPKGEASSMREKINLLMSELRRLADRGRIGILAAAAVSRSRDNRGKATYDGKHLSIASLRESGELEYGCDDCLILHPTDDTPNAPVRSMLLRHEKARYGEPKDVALSFHRRFQRFEVDPFLMVSPSVAVAPGSAHNNGSRAWASRNPDP